MIRSLVALGSIFPAIGSGIFLYFGLKEYLLPMDRRSLHGALAWAGFGAVLALLGVILLLAGTLSKKKKQE